MSSPLAELNARTYIPVPDNLTVCGLPPPLSVTLTDALLAPVAVGLRLTEIVQLAPAPIPVPQVFVVGKSPGFVPVTLIEVIESDVVPLFVRVTVLAALLVPTLTEPEQVFPAPGP